MKKIYNYLAIAALVICGIQIGHAQTSLGQKKDSSNPNSEPGKVISSSETTNSRLHTLERTAQPVPVYDQIHSPYRWYVIENAQNPSYWKSVNTERIWVELEINKSISDPEIAEFLSRHGLSLIIKESRFKELTNYYIFQNENTSPAQILEMARQARSIDGFLFLEPSAIYRQSYTPNDPLWNQQWGPFVSYFDEAWNYGRGGNSMNVVAVIDGACDWNHEDLFDQVWYGWDYTYGDPDISPDDPSHTHGTHVTGTVAATIGNGIGVAGMVNDTVYFAKVGDNQNGLNDQAIVDAIYDIGGIDRVSVVNMSLGSDAPNAAIEQACNFAWNNGKLLIVASGNNGQGFIGFPAAFPSCVAIGSIGADGMNLYLTAYSQYGAEQELCASGGDEDAGFGIVSTLPGNQYGSMQGTSMAAPHVAGLAGLIKNLNPGLTNADIRNILSATAFDMGNVGWDMFYGYGLVNALGAVEAALGTNTGIEKKENLLFELYPNPASDQLAIQLKTEMMVEKVEIFNITGQKVEAISNTTKKRVSVDVSGLSPGVYVLALHGSNGLSSAKFVKQ